MSDMDEEKKASIVYALPFPKKAEEVEENYDVAVYYDAWENDNDTDPVLSLVYEIIKQLGIKTELDIRRLDQKLQKQQTEHFRLI